ncbi:MAG: metallophosphoesterase [Eubacteriales bacterium]|nr:metallophosphoesterase [Eubacteriales bacterium]
MKMIHCADLHLDAKLQTNLDRENAKKRRNELLGNFERLAAFAAEEGVEAVLIAGDLFDREPVSALARNTVLEVIRAYPRIRFYYLRGNHDTGDCLGETARGGNLRLFGNRWKTYREGNTGLIAVSGMELTRENNASAHTSLRLNPSCFNIVMLHGQLTGGGRNPAPRPPRYPDADAETDLRDLRAQRGSRFQGTLSDLHGTDFSAQSGSRFQGTFSDPEGAEIPVQSGSRSAAGNAGVIDLRALRGRGIDYLALGHLHAGRTGQLDERGSYCYPGCLEGRGFDEPGPHGFMLLDIDEEKKCMGRRFIPFARRTLYTVDVDVGGCRTTAQMKGLVGEALLRAGCGRQDMAEVTLRGELEVDCEKDVDYILTDLRQRLFYARLRDATVLRVNPDDYLYDESLRGEFVRMVMADSSVSAEEKAAVIRCGFMAMDGEEPV